MRTDSHPVPPTNIFPTYINNLDIFFATSIHSFGHKEIGVVTGNRKLTAFFYLSGKRLCIVNKKILR